MPKEPDKREHDGELKREKPSRRLGRRGLLWHGEAGFEPAAGAAFHATNEAGDFCRLVHVDAHRAAATAEVALDAFIGVKTQVD
jgi:hypothetical protein